MGELDFTEYSLRLGEGLFADKVVLALSRFQHTWTVDRDERQTFKRARGFLAEAIEGGKSPHATFRSSQDAVSAKAFTHAVAAMVTPTPSKEEFLDYLGRLHSTLSKLVANEQVAGQELELVDAFFSRYAQVQFQRSESILESV